MPARAVALDIGCQPSPSGSAELILSGDGVAYVVFRAIDTKKSEQGVLKDLGVAVVECRGSVLTRHGYPNDEGRLEHPLWPYGLAESTLSVCQVLDSDWAQELDGQMETSARRIWGDSYEQVYNVAEGELRNGRLSHYLFAFKETTFECFAQELVVTMHEGSYAMVAEQVLARMLSDG